MGTRTHPTNKNSRLAGTSVRTHKKPSILDFELKFSYQVWLSSTATPSRAALHHAPRTSSNCWHGIRLEHARTHVRLQVNTMSEQCQQDHFMKERNAGLAMATCIGMPALLAPPMKSFSLPALLLLSLSGNAVSNEMIKEGWSTAAELGILSTSGNTVGTSVTGKIDVRQELPDWSNQYMASAYFKDDETTDIDGQTVKQRSAERYEVSAKAGYKLGEPNSTLFVLGSHVDDTFGAYEKYSSMSVGHGSRWHESEKTSLDVEIGPGYFRGERSDGQIENGVTVRAAAALRWQVSESSIFSQTVSVEHSEANTHSNAETALTARINGRMQMKAAFIARSDSNVPLGKKKTDTQTSLTLLYAF
jgi:putative salt-induced outer membrane protein